MSMELTLMSRLRCKAWLTLSYMNLCGPELIGPDQEEDILPCKSDAMHEGMPQGRDAPWTALKMDRIKQEGRMVGCS